MRRSSKFSEYVRMNKGMQMKGKKWIAILLVLLISASAMTGCSDNTEDVLGKVGDSVIYRWYYNAYLLSQLEAYLQQNSVNLTLPEYKEQLKEYKEYRLNDLVGEFALREEARKLGFDKLTAEQEREVDLQYQEYYDNAMEGFLATYGSDDEGRRKAEQAYIDLLKRSTLTPERLRQNFRDQYVLKLFMDSRIASQTVTDDEIKAYYDENLKIEQESFDKDPKLFGRSVTNATIYVPEGYYDTVRITKKLSAAQKYQLQQKGLAQSAKQIEFIGSYSSDPDSAATKSLGEELKALDEEYERYLEEIYSGLMTQIEPIREEVLAGADFIKTMEAKSDDVRRISYYVSKDSDHVDEAYRDAAMALENKGDISEIVRTDEGLCIIMLLEKLTPGAKPYEQVKEPIRKHLQSMRSVTLQLELMQEYSDKANEDGLVTLYPNKL